MRIPVEGVKEGVGRGRAIVVVPHAVAILGNGRHVTRSNCPFAVSMTP